MRALLEMALMKAMAVSAKREEVGRERRRAAGKPVVCGVCGYRGGTMYKRWGGYICRDCRRREKENEDGTRTAV